MNIIKYFIFLIITTVCYSQKINEENDKINKIIEYFISIEPNLIHNNIKIVDGFNPIIEAPAEFYITEKIFSKLNSSFTLNDSTYYFDQFKNIEHFQLRLKNKKYKYISKKDVNSFIEKVETDYEKGVKFDYYEEFDKKLGAIQGFGFPIISKDGNYLLFTYYSYGPKEKGKKITKLFKKQEKDWIYNKTIIDFDK